MLRPCACSMVPSSAGSGSTHQCLAFSIGYRKDNLSIENTEAWSCSGRSRFMLCGMPLAVESSCWQSTENFWRIVGWNSGCLGAEVTATTAAQALIQDICKGGGWKVRKFLVLISCSWFTPPYVFCHFMALTFQLLRYYLWGIFSLSFELLNVLPTLQTTNTAIHWKLHWAHSCYVYYTIADNWTDDDWK